MGHATRTTKLHLHLDKRDQGGANTDKQVALSATAKVLNGARAFYIDFLLAHAEKLAERVPYYSQKHLEMRERAISAHELLTWVEACTVATIVHPHPWEGWNFSQTFPGMPFTYRRSVIKDAIGKVRSFLSNRAHWEKSGKKKSRPGWPGSANHPTLYEGAFSLQLDALDKRESFVRLKVYTGQTWMWVHYPVKYSRYFEQRLAEPGWEQHSPKLVLGKHTAQLHFSQTKEIMAKKIQESKLDSDLVTVAVDLNVKNLAVVTVRSHGKLLESVFLTDHGLDQHRYRHLKRIARKQWQSGKAVKGEHSNHQLWQHVRHMNEGAAHQVAARIVAICARYPGCVLLFERLRKIKQGSASKSRRMSRRQSNQLRGKINQYSKDKAYAQGTVTVEVNPWGTSQHCSRCGAKGERFSQVSGKRVQWKGGKLFWCPQCHYQANADHNASSNLHHSFFGEFCWQPKAKRKPPG